jgi:hypothetical protein
MGTKRPLFTAILRQVIDERVGVPSGAAFIHVPHAAVTGINDEAPLLRRAGSEEHSRKRNGDPRKEQAVSGAFHAIELTRVPMPSMAMRTSSPLARVNSFGGTMPVPVRR